MRGGHGEPVPAQLFVLVSGDGVYLEVKDGAQAYIAELEDEINVRQVPVSSLQEGTFLIVRPRAKATTSANWRTLLGARALHLRELQSRWKQELDEKISRIGARAVGHA